MDFFIELSKTKTKVAFGKYKLIDTVYPSWKSCATLLDWKKLQPFVTYRSTGKKFKFFLQL